MEEEELTTRLTVHLQGGLAPLFNNQTQLTIDLPHPHSDLDSHTSKTQTQTPRLKNLITYLTKLYLPPSVPEAKRSLFVLPDSSLRPGILVLVDDADWELEGGEERELRSGEVVVFVSTLHGG